MLTKDEEVEHPGGQRSQRGCCRIRRNIDTAEYKHIVCPPMFLNYISNTFEDLEPKAGYSIPAATPCLRKQER